MKIRAGLPPGVHALAFDAARQRRRLEARLCEQLDAEGFDEILLPILDYFDPYEPLLAASSRDRLYRFVDRDGQLLALRGDFTPMLARLLAPRLEALSLPQRLFYRGDVVRYQEVRPGRMREYSELGAEVLDHPSHQNDEAVLDLFVRLLLSVCSRPEAAGRAGAEGGCDQIPGLRVVVGLAGALDGLTLGLGGDRQTLQAIARRDRRVARATSPVLGEIVEHGCPRELGQLGEKAAQRVESLINLCSRLESRYGSGGVHLGVDLAEFARCSLQESLRGSLAERSYYDGIVFRAYAVGETHTLGRGGRYDRLFSALGADVGATGFSLALDRLIESPAAKAGDVEAAS